MATNRCVKTQARSELTASVHKTSCSFSQSSGHSPKGRAEGPEGRELGAVQTCAVLKGNAVHLSLVKAIDRLFYLALTLLAFKSR